MSNELNKKTYYFMAGLPRSGSTMLSAILNQNPDIYSGPSSPIIGLMVNLENYMANDELFLAYPKIDQAKQIISSAISHYYSDINKPIIIDKNRAWVNKLEYIENYFDIQAKVLCPVRSIDEVLTSFISMHRRNPYEINGKINFMDEMLVKNNMSLTDDNRCELLASANGILGQSYTGLKDAVLKGYEKQLHFIEYDDLINNPKETMEKIYQFLEIPYFEHDFNNLINLHQEDDAKIYGISDMHSVRKELKSTSLNPEEVLSEYMLNQCKDAEFWRNLTEVKFDDTYHEEESNETKVLDSNSNLIG